MRLLNALFENEHFAVDEQSVPYIVRDIINMNWWNTCDYLIGYAEKRRITKEATYEQKLSALILMEYYGWRIDAIRNRKKLQEELHWYLHGKVKVLRQLSAWSQRHRRNDSQSYHKDSEPTWLDCTSRATYAWKYVGQNGYMDFDGIVRTVDGSKIRRFINKDSVYPDKEKALSLFDEGTNMAKNEIFRQRTNQRTVEQWCEDLNIKALPERQWLFDKIKHVKTDPYKSNEKRLLKEGELTGVNEELYGFYTKASTSKKLGIACHASHASRASHASNSSYASSASSVSNASRASYASSVSNASRASRASNGNSNWLTVPAALGPVDGLEHPPVFQKNKYGIAGNWKINKDLVAQCSNWFDPFCGWGTSPLYAKANNKNYLGFDLNKNTMDDYLLPYVQRAIDDCEINDAKVEIRHQDSSVFLSELVNTFDLCYTSPPYFQFEEYGFTSDVVWQCKTYAEFHEKVTIPVFKNVYEYLIEGGVLALQTEKDKKKKDEWIKVITSTGFKLLEDTITGREANKYSQFSKRDQSLLVFVKESENVKGD